MKKSRNEAKNRKSAKSDIPSRSWYKNTMAVFGLISVITATASGLIVLMQKFEPTKVLENNVIVFDRSAAMNDSFGEGTKLDAAIEAVNDTLGSEVASADNLALRSFGGPCDGANSQMVIGFRQNNEDRVRNAVRTFQAGGNAALTSALIEATGDFNDPRRFEGMNKRIIVITGGGDACQKDPAKYIRDRLANVAAGNNINVSFRFIGMALDAEQRNELNSIAEETSGLSEETLNDQVFFVDSKSELKKVLQGIVEVEPVLDTVNKMAKSMNNITNQLNPAISAINSKNFSAATESLRAAQSEFNTSKPLMASLQQRLNVGLFYEQLQNLYDLTSVNQDLQQKQLELLQTMIDQGKLGDTKALSATIDEWNGIISQFDGNIIKMDQIIEDVQNKLHETQSTALPSTFMSASTVTPAPTMISAPTATPGTLTLTGLTMANCRTGPSISYEVYSNLKPDQTVKVFARNELSTWFLTENPHAGFRYACWISIGPAVQINGDPSTVPIVWVELSSNTPSTTNEGGSSSNPSNGGTTFTLPPGFTTWLKLYFCPPGTSLVNGQCQAVPN